MSVVDTMPRLHGRDLLLRLRALIAPRRVERELDDELAFHVEREAQKLIAAGLPAADARRRALARFGPVPLAADQCRDARGTAALETMARDVMYALRMFRRAPLAAGTIVATVALGLALVTVVFTLFNISFLRVDAVRNPDELFGVKRPVSPNDGAWLPLTRRDYEAVRQETTVFSDVVATLWPVGARIDGRSVTSALVTGNFFQALGVSAVLGRPLLPDDDKPGAARNVIVLSDRGWRKLFAADPTVIGRGIRINGVLHDVVGVMPPDLRGLAIVPPDYWAPIGLVGLFRSVDASRENEVEVDVVGRLRRGMTADTAAAALSVWESGRADRAQSRYQPARVTLEARQGTVNADAIEVLAVFTPIFFTFGLILLIGCANVANLQLARGLTRQREIGIRLALGASRGRVVRQLLTESLLLALAAAAAGFGLARLIQEGTLAAVAATLPPEVAAVMSLDLPPADWRVVAFVVAGAIASTLLFGLAPALQSTRLELVRTMRGEVARYARPRRARHALIALQVAASALLLVCAGVLLRSAVAAAGADPGVRTSDTVIIFVANENRRAALLEAVRTHPTVAAVAASGDRKLADVETLAADGAAAGGRGSSRTAVDQVAVSPEYLGLLDIVIVRGRGFTPTERSADAGVALVSQSVARELWPTGTAVGQALRLDASNAPQASSAPTRTLTVVGVVRDIIGPLAGDMLPSRGVYVPSSPETRGTSLMLRVHGDPEQARQRLLDDLTRVDPGLGQIQTVRTMARLLTYVLQIAFWVAVGLGALALGLTVSGLFSVLSFIVAQRTKDIGVHMALGASGAQASRLVLTQLLRPVGVGVTVGIALAAAVATLLMAASKGEVGTLINVFDPAAYAAGLLVIALSCLLAAAIPALRAARVDPIAALRRD